MKNLITFTMIITTYNSAKYVKMYKKFIQDWPGSLEVIFVDDCSTDGTQDEIIHLKQELSNANKIIKYIFHDINLGVSKSFNDALDIATGEIFLQNDADDIPCIGSLIKLLEIMKKNHEIDLIQASTKINHNERGVEIKNPLDLTSVSYNSKLKKILLGDGIVFQPGSRLIRKSSFNQLIGDEVIFDSREGQNWQIILPFYLSGNVYFSKMATIVVGTSLNSHSRYKREKWQEINRVENFLIIWTNSLRHISRKDLKIMSEVKYVMLLNIAYRNNDKMLAIKSFIHGRKNLKSFIKVILTVFLGGRPY